MKVDGKIGISQAIMTIMLTVGITNHVTVIPLLLSSAKRDAWLSVLLASIPFIGWVCLLAFINTRLHRQPLNRWILRTSGKFGGYLILTPLLVSLYGMALVHLIDTQTWTTVNYLPRTPEWVTALVLVLLCAIAAYGGIGPLGMTAGVLLPLVALLGFYVAFGNMPKKDYSFLLPVYQFGPMPILHGMIYAGGGFAELVLLLLLQHHVRQPLRLIHFLIMFVIIIILTLSPLTGAIAEFGPIESSRQRFPAFEQWRLLTIGKDIENMEFFAIFQWLSGSFTRITLCLMLMTEILNVHTVKARTLVLLVLGGSMIAVTGLRFSDMTFVRFLSDLYYPIYLVMTILLTLMVAGLALRKPNREERADHDA
ncbi:endospore germination permease [Brevibacillus brevis]|uniref:Endospore germination permease n=1 Tax=Brevibacillus brevis TaxID=1393 RepID=A0ABY9T1Z7_BREBE|nr:endospore germination permease [Brevibacillus brevis]WNC14130.1 endospore germination permease [Brevibacillus brevis]